MTGTKKRIVHFAATLVLMGIGVLVFLVLTASKPQLERTKPPAPMPMVRVATIKTGPQAVTIRGEGTVTPVREIELVPQVSGNVVFISPAMVDGGAFKKGDILLRIDPLDYQLAVTLARAKVKDAESRLRVAEEEAAAAKEEWRLLYQSSNDFDGDPPSLVAKEPQLAADRADLQKALLALKRTELTAPFNGRISDENVDVGQYVSTTKPLATLFSTEAAEIVIPFEDEALFWFSVPGFTPGDGPGSAVKVKARVAGRELSWSGKVVRAEGKLDERTRMINVVVRVEKPYATRPPLAAGLFVTAEIQGRTLKNAAVIPRSALRDNGMVWVVDGKGQLIFRQVEIARLDTNQAILRGGLKDGDRLVTSGLKAVTDGMKVRISPQRGGNKT